MAQIPPQGAAHVAKSVRQTDGHETNDFGLLGKNWRTGRAEDRSSQVIDFGCSFAQTASPEQNAPSLEISLENLNALPATGHSLLDTIAQLSYPALVIGFLRFIGIMNAAVWLGSAIFFAFGAAPACFSPDMKAGLGTGNPYYAGAIELVVMSRYYHVALACGVVALLHLGAEWLYMGRPARKFSFGLIVGMFALTLIAGDALQPKLVALNKQRYRAPAQADRDAAAKTFRLVNGTREVFNALIIAGLVVYTWRIANPSDTLRFLGPVQFRG